MLDFMKRIQQRDLLKINPKDVKDLHVGYIVYTQDHKILLQKRGFDGFIPLIDSGISIYIWASAKFFSIVLYTCKGFDEEKAIEFAHHYFQTVSRTELVTMSF